MLFFTLETALNNDIIRSIVWYVETHFVAT